MGAYEDAAAAILAIAESELTGIVNIGSGVPTSLADAALILAMLAGDRESGLGRRPERKGEPNVLLPDTKRLFQTGWQPRIPLTEGLSRTYEWWARQSKMDDHV